MKIIAGLATFKGREESLKDTIQSLNNQVDELYIYDNSKNIDRKDNGKFFGLTQINEPCYYLTCDDDIIYPSGYIDSIINGIKDFNCIVTHHGKKIKRSDNFFESSESFHFSVRNYENKYLDVAGTGVTGFSTEYFNPVELFYNENFFVSDLLFSIRAKEDKKNIMLLKHSTNWIKQNMNIDFQKSISYIEFKDERRQLRFKNKLLDIKDGKYNI